MKELEELTLEIREKLPRLMELTEGQNLESLINDSSVLIVKGEIFTIGKFDCFLSEKDNEIEVGGYYYQAGKEFKIIGRDPMISDVLEWFDENYTIQVNEGFFTRGWFDTEGLFYEWDMSKPYLKDQSPELIKFLHSLIKTK